MRSMTKRSHPSVDHANIRSRKISNNSSRDTEMEEPPSVTMEPVNDKSISFLEKVRRSKEQKTQPAQAPSAPSTPTSKLSIAAYRASRGLPPLPASPISRQTNTPPVSRQNTTTLSTTINPPPRPANGPGPSNASSSLFINKRKPPVSVSYFNKSKQN